MGEDCEDRSGLKMGPWHRTWDIEQSLGLSRGWG